jgi:hypothetical protein
LITEKGFEFLHRTIKSNIDKPQALIGSNWEDGIIQKMKVTDNSVQIYCYFDETVVGNITRYRILGKDGNVFLEKSDSITKTNEKGLLVLFEIQIKEG